MAVSMAPGSLPASARGGETASRCEASLRRPGDKQRCVNCPLDFPPVGPGTSARSHDPLLPPPPPPPSSMFFKRTVAELLAEPDDVATTPPVAPPTHRFGVPDGAISLAVDALQQTVAVGARSGEVMLFAGGAQMLLPPPVDSPVRHLAFATNSGRLLSIHAPGTACIWDLRDSVRLEARSKLTEPSGTDAVISIAKMIPGSSLALLGTAEGTALAYDVVEGKAAPWSLGCRSSSPR